MDAILTISSAESNVKPPVIVKSGESSFYNPPLMYGTKTLLLIITDNNPYDITEGFLHCFNHISSVSTIGQYYFHRRKQLL